MNTTEKIYQKVIDKFEKKATINKLYPLLCKYERFEDFDACVVINAIKNKSK